MFGAGTTTPVGDNGITWEDDQEGTVYMIIEVRDPSGSSANFSFPVYVWRGEGDLQVNFEFNTYPTIAVDVTVTEANMPDLSDVNIFLESASYDPDGNPVVSTTWTEDCNYASLITDPTSLNALLAPTQVEVCNVTQTACDSRGCNEVIIELNIECTTLGNGFDPLALGAEPFNECFLAGICDPALVGPHPTDDCLANGWECGLGLDNCPIPGAVDCEAAQGQTCVARLGYGATCNVTTQLCETCVPAADPCAGAVCGTVIDTCNNPVVCGTCPTNYGCVAGACECTEAWMCVYGNNNNVEDPPGVFYRPKQCDDLVGAGLDETAAFAWCDTFTIGGIFEPFEPEIQCGTCQVDYLPYDTGKNGSPPVPIGGICDILSDPAMPRNAFSENTQAVEIVECDVGTLYTGAWACDAYGGIWTCFL
jgi:hypothetical protein